MNGEHLRHLGASRLAEKLAAELPGLAPSRAAELIAAVLPRSRTTLDLARQARIRAGLDAVSPDEKAAAAIAEDPAGHLAALQLVLDSLRGAAEWSAAGLEAHLRRVAEAKGLEAGAVMQPVRIALTGATVSEPVNELLVVIGRDEALARLERALQEK
jgi:glutamyl-tRNA synthetase